MGIRKRLNYIGLYTLGCVMGLAGMGFYSSGKITLVNQFFRGEVAKTVSGGSEAYACTNHEDTESVFFVSCGGIY